MQWLNRKQRLLLQSFLRHDLGASFSVFFVALPLCLGISVASNAPLFSGVVAGIAGGIVVSLISKSPLSVSGPAAGLTAICATAITELGSLQAFFFSVAISGLLQILLGTLRLGGFTHLIPSSVIKGMLSAIGLLLISKQVPLLIGYDRPDFWTNELFNIFTFNHSFSHIQNLYEHGSAGAIVITLVSLAITLLYPRYLARHLPFLPSAFIMVCAGALMAWLFRQYLPFLQLSDSQYVSLPGDFISQIQIPAFNIILDDANIWRTAVLMAFVASLETLLSVEAIDKIDPYNRITPQNRELVAQGTGNIISGLAGGLPVTAVIVRSAANAEAGAKSRLSSIFHGVWLLLVMLAAIPLINGIPYCVLAVILVRTGYHLAKPSMIRAVYRQGREQFLPFLVTAAAILFTDLLIGVLIGIAYALYFLIKHTYRAGFTIKERLEGHTKHYTLELALNVSFLNKKKIRDTLDSIPEFSIVEVSGLDSVYIDNDVLEIIHDFKSKAHRKHIQLVLHGIRDVETIELH